jgi:hypothetical protein
MSRFLKILFLIFAALALLACSIPFTLNEPTTTATQTPAGIAPPTVEPTLEPTTTQIITVYFTDIAKFNLGTEPYEVAVTRPLPAGMDPVRAVLDAFFAGPTVEESAQGLVLISSGFTGVGELSIENGIARIHLVGKCANNGAAYSVASVIHKNLEQFPQITAIKIYDENGDNLDPDSPMSSVPYCLEP